jgi:hypothetical protein
MQKRQLFPELRSIYFLKELLISIFYQSHLL